MSTHYTGTAQEELVLDTWTKLSRAKNTLDQHVRQQLDQLGLTVSQFGVMEILHHLGPLPLKSIGGKILLTPSNLVTVTDNLEKAGLVSRCKHPQDRRSTLISLTEAGTDKIKPVFASHLQLLMNLFSPLSQEDQQVLGVLSKQLGLSNQPNL